MSTTINQKEYLKRYLSGKDGSKKKKKNKKKSDGRGMKIIEDSDGLMSLPFGYSDDDDAPTVAEVTYDDERLKALEEFQASSDATKWKALGVPLSSSGGKNSDLKALHKQRHELGTPPSRSVKLKHDVKKQKSHSDTLALESHRNYSDIPHHRKLRHDSNDSPPSGQRNALDASPRRPRHDSDTSPPRMQRHDLDTSHKRQRHDLSASPPRQQRHVSDTSPPRSQRHDSDSSSRRKRYSDASPLRRQRNDSDASPPRRQRHDSDTSPSRQQRHDSDASPPRRQRHDSDASPPRRQRHDSDASPPRRQRQDSDTYPPRRQRCNSDASPLRKQRHDSDESPFNKYGELQYGDRKYQRVTDRLAGNSERKMTTQEYLQARRFGKLRHETPEDIAKKEHEEELQAKAEEKHKDWNRGMRQMASQQQLQLDALHEMGKGLARHADDEDLNEKLKAVTHKEDPMAEYIMKKKAKERKHPIYPEYKGSYPPNRYGICPGYRWDGVNRSNGFEKQWFECQNRQKAESEELYKWNVSDM